MRTAAARPSAIKLEEANLKIAERRLRERLLGNA
jgi:hypothetical protein